MGTPLQRYWVALLLVRVVDDSIRLDVVGDLEERGQEFLSLTSVKNAIEVRNVVDLSKLPSGSPLKRSTGVLFVISEEEELRCEVAQSGKKRNQKMVMPTSTGGLKNEIGLSKMAEINGQGPSVTHFDVLLFGGFL